MTVPSPPSDETGRLMCARCLVNVRQSQQTGCLCDACEAVIEPMTQAEVDADYKRFLAEVEVSPGRGYVSCPSGG